MPEYIPVKSHEKAVQKASELSGVDYEVVENLVRNVFSYQVTKATDNGQFVSSGLVNIRQPFHENIFNFLSKLAEKARPTVTINLTEKYENLKIQQRNEIND